MSIAVMGSVRDDARASFNARARDGVIIIFFYW